MEYCIEARALKSSFLSELAMMKKSTQTEFLCVNGINGVSCDDFSVDVFLDLSNEEEFVEEEYEEEEKDSLSVSSQDNRVEDDTFNSTTNFTGIIDSASFSAGELSVPVDDLEHLEWLSQFVEDSVSEFSFLCPTGNFKENIENQSEPVMIQRAPNFCFPTPVPAKARSKRSRPSCRAWSRASSSLSESSSTTSSSCGYSPTFATVFSNLVPATDLIVEPPVKKHKKIAVAEETGVNSGGGGYLTQRRCSHCQVQKTPQWRTGPLGAKTLCNACGVRYKSGRLFPEYRPACSPTFSGDVHSNSHRKVLEMRRQKVDVPGVESGLTSVGWSS